MLRCEGPNLNNQEPEVPGEFLYMKGRMFDEKYSMVGTEIYKIVDNGTNVVHIVELLDGSRLEFKFPLSFPLQIAGPLDQAFVNAFPQATPYLGVPGAGSLIFQSDQFKSNTSILSWTGTGIFKDATFIECRCTYVTIDSKITECLHCTCYIGQQPLFNK